MQTNEKKIRLCMIGAGRFARHTHDPVLQEIVRLDPNVALTGVCDLQEDNARQIAGHFPGARAYLDFRVMLAQEKPDGVLIFTPPPVTAEIGAGVLALGYPVMLEKPPGRNRREFESLQHALEIGRTHAMVAFNRRHSPFFAQALHLIEKEAPGEQIEHIQCAFFRYHRHDADLTTTSIHGIDAVRCLSGSHYRDLEIFYQHLPGRDCEVVNTFLAGTMENGCTVLLSFCPSTGALVERFVLNTPSLTVIIGSVPPGGGGDFPGYIELHRNSRFIRREALPEHPLDHLEFYLSGYFGEHMAFICSLRNGIWSETDFSASFEAVEIADACRNGLTHYTRNAKKDS